MRFLHTSDWHLGRTLHGVSLAEAQAVAVGAVVDLAIDRQVDVFIVAGDVFDRAVPPVDALRVLNDAVTRLADAGIVTVLCAGNHDSGDRLAIYGGVLRDGVHLVGSLDGIGSAIELSDAHGAVRLYALPYLEPDVAREALRAEEPIARSHEAVVAAAMERITADRQQHPAARAIVVGHAFVADVSLPEASDSERDLTVGGIAIVPARVFAGVDYVALGHLHRGQVVRDADPHIRYSGSLLRYSFSEAAHEKAVAIVELGPAGSDPQVELIAVPQPRAMRRLSGPMDELLSDAHADAREAFVELIVTDPLYPDRMHARLDEVFPYALRKAHVPAGSDAIFADETPRLGRDPLDLVHDFLTRITGSAPDEVTTGIIRQAYESVRAGDD